MHNATAVSAGNTVFVCSVTAVSAGNTVFVCSVTAVSAGNTVCRFHCICAQCDCCQCWQHWVQVSLYLCAV